MNFSKGLASASGIFIKYLFAGGGIIFLFAYAAPSIFDFFELMLERPLPYELAVRLTIGAVAAPLILFGAAQTCRRGTRLQGEIFLIILGAMSAMFVVLAFDRGHRLMEEFSWIRYTTSGFLLLAAGGALFSGRHAAASGGVSSTREFTPVRNSWYALSALFFYGAADEVLQIHEALGGMLVKSAQLPPFVTDLVTMGYALAGFAVLVFSAKKFVRYLETVAPLTLVLFTLGVLIFGLATALDTFDVTLQALFRWYGEQRMAAGGWFSDRWYLIWAPKNFTNGFEEVLEYLAAALFFSAVWSYLRRAQEQRASMIHSMEVDCKKIGKVSSSPDSFEPANYFLTTVVRKHLIRLCATLGIVALAALIIMGVSAPVANGPLKEGEWLARPLGSAREGLFHADDLALSDTFGVVVANEGGNSLLAWKDGTWRELVGAREGLRNPDSIAVEGDTIYISAADEGIIFSYREKTGLVREWTAADGLRHPEGLVTVAGALFVLDESQKTITLLEKGRPPRVWKPEHPLWQAPEGIAYDRKTKTLLVTDDVSGALFRLEFEKKIELLARFNGPEDVTLAVDGAILVTDNAEGTVYLFDANLVEGNDGRAKLFHFRRPYLDLQGIASSSDGRIYVISADGFGSSSWMPSVLWELSKPQ